MSAKRLIKLACAHILLAAQIYAIFIWMFSANEPCYGCDPSTLYYLMPSIASVVGLLLALLAWRWLPKFSKIICSLLGAFTLVYLPQTLFWGWYDFVHPPHLLEYAQLNELGREAVSKGDLKEAERIFSDIRSKERTLFFQDDHFSTAFNLGAVFEKEGKLEDAERTYLNAIDDIKAARLHPAGDDLDPLIMANQKLAYIYLKQKRFREAAQEFDLCIKISENENKSDAPYVCNLHADLSKVLQSEGQFDEAKREMDKSKQIQAALVNVQDHDASRNFGDFMKRILHLK